MAPADSLIRAAIVVLGGWEHQGVKVSYTPLKRLSQKPLKRR